MDPDKLTIGQKLCDFFKVEELTKEINGMTDGVKLWQTKKLIKAQETREKVLKRSWNPLSKRFWSKKKA